MKHLNKAKFIVLFMFGSFLITSNLSAGDIIFKIFKQPKPIQPKPIKPPKPIGAPLDAGLLSILGTAGVGYYLMRRKNNKENNNKEIL